MLKKIKFLQKKDNDLENKISNRKKNKVSQNKIKEKNTKFVKQTINDAKCKPKVTEDIQNQKLKDQQNIVKKMSKRDLLELLIVQRKRITELESELIHVKEQLTNKEIIIKNAGSIAEAALKLNEVFEKAQEAANQYLENVKKSKKNE